MPALAAAHSALLLQAMAMSPEHCWQWQESSFTNEQGTLALRAAGMFEYSRLIDKPPPETLVIGSGGQSKLVAPKVGLTPSSVQARPARSPASQKPFYADRAGLVLTDTGMHFRGGLEERARGTRADIGGAREIDKDSLYTGRRAACRQRQRRAEEEAADFTGAAVVFVDLKRLVAFNAAVAVATAVAAAAAGRHSAVRAGAVCAGQVHFAREGNEVGAMSEAHPSRHLMRSRSRCRHCSDAVCR